MIQQEIIPKQKMIVLLKILALLICLYTFFLSISLMGSAFKSFADLSQALVEKVSNPIIGLFIGILATSIIQSSSTTTSIVVGMVAGGMLASPEHSTIELAIPIIMGANIGTSITNTIVSLGHISRNKEFERAFSVAVVHDFFNIISVIILMPLEISFHLIKKTSIAFTKIFVSTRTDLHFSSPIKIITKPIVNLIWNGKNGICDMLLSPQIGRWLAILIAFILLFLALKYLVKIMRSMVLVKAERFFDRFLFRNAFFAFSFGLILTATIQSSSITTSLMVPLVGTQILNIYQIFPYTLGANVGTTITAILASLATGNVSALTVAFSHLFFNTFGIIILYPVKIIRNIPIELSKMLAYLSVKRKIIPILYILIIFFLIPLLIIFTKITR